MNLAFGGRRHDQYYTLTAMLAARGAQTVTSRLIGGVIFGLGLCLLLGLLGSVEVQWAAARVVFGVVVVCCFGMASVWLRHRWPTRTESTLLVALGTVGLAGCCIMPADPWFGFLGATVFAVLAGYTALFHSLRLLALVLAVAGAVVVYLAARLAAHGIIWPALAAVILILVLTVFAVFTCRIAVQLSGTEDGPDAIEPLTGLLNRDSFYDMTATLLASRSRNDDRYLVIAVLNIDSFAAMVSMVGARGGSRARITAGQALRETVRHDAIVGHVGESDYLIADSFTAPDPSPLIERVRSAIAATPSGMTASIGVVSTPLRPLADRPPDDVIDEIVALATTAMYEARRAGGNQARYVLHPSWGVADDQDTEPDSPPV